MMRVLWLAGLLTLIGPVPALAQLTVTAPSGGANPVASANDFATRTFQDPMDMNERTDLGWWLNSVDQPLSGWSATTFSGGVFHGTVSADPNLWVLESNAPNLPAIGRNGSTYPIDANTYRIFAVRMRVQQPAYALFLWSTNTIYDPPGLQTAGIVPGTNTVQVPTTAGWRIYFVDLAGLALINGTEPWNGVKRSLRFDPAPDNAPAGSVIDVDWIRLVDYQPALMRTITWTGAGGPVDIYLDDNASPTSNPDATLGLVAAGVSGASYDLNAGALAPGRYYVAIRRAGTNDAFTYSSGYFEVNEAPTIQVTAPSEEGSSDDFATVNLNDPWDMANAGDVDTTVNVSGGGIGTIAGAETEAGTPLGTMTGFLGTSTTGVFDPRPCESFAKPAVYPLHPAHRGSSRRIDPAKYRILTAELGIPNKARDLCGGSIARVVWQVAGEAGENYSWGIPVNSRAGANVVDRLILDMATLPVDPASPSRSGWVAGASASPGISGFRIDPHEFANPTSFYITRLKLAAFETANTSYTVKWTTTKRSGTVHVYYDTDRDPAVKTLIGSVAADSLHGSLSWPTAGLPEGSLLYVYVEQDDGENVNGAYGRWPVQIRHAAAATARIVLNRTALNFGVFNQTVKSPAQAVRLSTLDAPSGQPCWTASSELWFLHVTPASGCGSTVLTVALEERAYPPDWNGDYTGAIRVTSPGAINSPQGQVTTVRIRSTSAPPLGTVDTPADNAIVSGSVAMTGWAVDDIGIARVTICRDPAAGESVPPNPSCAAGQIYLGDAVSIDDARPDVEAFASASPFNYRAGWGFLILTNMLPNQGTGTFMLHARAFDLDGQSAWLGSRAIVGQNATATEPFGAIDTPGQGETIGGANYPNFGWVLSRVRRADPPGGGAVSVIVDGVTLGSPCCWTARADLTAAFPGYPGIDRALGVFGLNTYAFGNGLHTIVWVVTDIAGQTSGVGSRFFSIFNTDAAAMTGSATRPAGPDLGLRADALGSLPMAGDVALRAGLAGPVERLDGEGSGVRHVRLPERTRLELRLPPAGGASATRVDAYLVAGNRLRELPTGAAFDPARGILYWQPGLAYVGDYDLLFVRTDAAGHRESLPIRVTLGHDWTQARALRLDPARWGFRQER
jgi:hypothetical protein